MKSGAGSRGRTVDLLVLVVAIFNAANVEVGLVGKNDATRHEPAITREKHRIQHALIEQEVTHPFAHDDIHLFHRERNRFDLALDTLNCYEKG